jgi:hypothetical protein
MTTLLILIPILAGIVAFFIKSENVKYFALSAALIELAIAATSQVQYCSM